MNSPFEFGKVVKGKNFTDRKAEIKRLLSNFDNKINTILISPRRWGKFSLVEKSSDVSINKKNVFCFIDLFHIRSEKEFYALYTKMILKSAYGRTKELTDTVKNFLKALKPKLVLPIDQTGDFEIEMNFDLKGETYLDILELPEKISKKKNVNLIVCIDEFQNIQYFEDPILFQKRLRSVWQHHYNCVYCIYGSKKHMMMNLFQEQSMPFYKSGDLIHLGKIAPEYFVPFIAENFKRTKKIITKELAEKIVELADCHPYYVQQLSHLVWINTDKKVTEYDLKSGIEDMINQNSAIFTIIADSLSNKQINFLKALANGHSELLSSQKVIQDYDLSSSANVSKIKKSLEQKEVIDNLDSKIIYLDPVFKLWFSQKYLK